MLQFGHGTDAVDDVGCGGGTPPAPPSFNSATALTPWMTCPWRTMRTAGSRSFNSATALTPWMTAPLACRRCRAMSFNSATALTPWMTLSDVAPICATAELQFGHGTDAVDDLVRWREKPDGRRSF